MRGSPSSRLPIWILVLAVPLLSAAVITYLYHNVLSILLTFIGSLFWILITSLITGIGQQLQNVLAPDIFVQVRNYIRGGAYEQRYRSRMLRECEVLDTTGLPAKPGRKFQLTHVFVEPYLINKPLQRTSTDLIKPPDLSQYESQTIWYYLKKTKEHLVILGAPGGGKTTLLRHVAGEFSKKRNQHELAISNPHPLPFLLLLRNYGEVIKASSPFSLVDAIELELSRWEKPPVGWVEYQMTRKGSLVLLDGLDEVAYEPTRRHVVNWVHDQMTAYYECQFVLTSRHYGYEGNELSDPIVIEVQSFTPEQISDCIERWYLEWLTAGEERQDDEVRVKARKKAEDLRRRMRRKHALWKLAINPFLLHMIAIVHDYGNTLPEKRVELYKEICKIFLGTRDEARNIIHPLSSAQQQWVLEKLAYQLMYEKELTIPRQRAEELIAEALIEINPKLSPGAFLDLVEQRSGLLREKKFGFYGFAHKAFQEYLAAVYIGGERGDVGELVKRVGDDWWHETILLYCAQNNATPLIEACLEGTPPPIKMLRFALECRNEAQRMKIGTRTRLDRLISQERVADQDPISRRNLAEALLENRLSDNQLIPFSEAEDAFISPSLINCVEYQLFLDELQGEDASKEGAPDHWEDDHFAPGHGHHPVLGIRPSDAIAFCSWLTERENSSWCYRLPVKDERQEIVTQLAEAGESLPECGFWLDAGKTFAWVKQDGQGLTEHLFQERLAQDHNQLLNASQEGERDDIIACLNGTRRLTYIQTIHYDLIQTFLQIRSILNKHISDAQVKYAQTKSRVDQLKAELRNIRNEQASIQANSKKNTSEFEYNDGNDDSILPVRIRRDISSLTTKINHIDTDLKIARREKTEGEGEYQRERHRWLFQNKQRLNDLQTRITERSNQIVTLETQLTQHQQDLAVLETKANTDTLRSQTPRKINRKQKEAIEEDLERLRKQEADIKANINQAQEQLEPLALLASHLRKLSNICDDALASTLNYDRSQPLKKAIDRNAALHFDSIFKSIGSIDPVMLTPFYVLVNSNISDLVATTTKFVSAARSNIDNRELTKLTHLSSELVNVLEHATFQHDVEILVNALRSFYAELITHRPLGKAAPINRTAMRYSAWRLAECLSYWLEERQDLPSPRRNALKVRDAYLNLAVTLTLLEERIERKLAPSEGIVLVREHRQQASL